MQYTVLAYKIPYSHYSNTTVGSRYSTRVRCFNETKRSHPDFYLYQKRGFWKRLWDIDRIIPQRNYLLPRRAPSTTRAYNYTVETTINSVYCNRSRQPTQQPTPITSYSEYSSTLLEYNSALEGLKGLTDFVTSTRCLNFTLLKYRVLEYSSTRTVFICWHDFNW
jgi:hypothetical protein